MTGNELRVSQEPSKQKARSQSPHINSRVLGIAQISEMMKYICRISPADSRPSVKTSSPPSHPSDEIQGKDNKRNPTQHRAELECLCPAEHPQGMGRGWEWAGPACSSGCTRAAPGSPGALGCPRDGGCSVGSPKGCRNALRDMGRSEGYGNGLRDLSRP